MTTASHHTSLDTQSASTSVVTVWDWGTRLYHWLQALLVSLLLASGLSGYGDTGVHIVSGLLLTVLLCWRWVWGVVGSTAARFSRFPLRGRDLRQFLKSGQHPEYGHNPLSAWMVVALLTGLTLQVISGMVMTGLLRPGDTLLPLLEPALLGWHEVFPNVLLGLIAVHIAAAISHGLKRDRVVAAMVDGRATSKPGAEPVRLRSGKLAALVFLCALLLVIISVLFSQL